MRQEVYHLPDQTYTWLFEQSTSNSTLHITGSLSFTYRNVFYRSHLKVLKEKHNLIGK